jgi:hypothetical protein
MTLVTEPSNQDGAIHAQIDDNPSDLSDFKSLATLFEWYRVNSMKVQYIPFFMAETTSSTIKYHAAVIFHDTNAQSGGPSIVPYDTAIQYENSKIVNLQCVGLIIAKCIVVLMVLILIIVVILILLILRQHKFFI